ncbi:Acetoacetate decarboxylase (ADC) [Sinosporangium album]|uniref:Acetoacetate decarboxylase (ADC) n=1 Tax=Sinosporangium album TaxID=504805 RepID=A0A1G7W1L5_9ACTN|nr:acetoacetate decarboxylase family protein [Sinosporangium album]SDG65579.1 Acetoacetate decarboxylase (ADC) [Sinosporangium album]
MARHEIQGRTITTPVRVHAASLYSASYLVRADPARAVIAYSGLDVTEVVPGKALCSLLFVDHTAGDLGSYHEFGVCFAVRPPGAPRAPGGRRLTAGLDDIRAYGTGAFVHWLPVDQSLTLEAGRSIWGYPKELADIDLRLNSPYKRCVLRTNGRLALDLLIRPGIPTPPPVVLPPIDTYTHHDGITRRVTMRLFARGVRARPGGAHIRLGNHPIAKELSELGLPRRPLFTATAGHISMLIDDAVRVFP